MQIAIPLKASEGGGNAADYETTIDSQYLLHTMQLKNYPIPNIYADGTDISQEAWGLQITSRAAQNTAWKGSLALNAAVGTGTLTRDSFTGKFNQTIAIISNASLQLGYFMNDPVYTFGYSVANNLTWITAKEGVSSGANVALAAHSGDSWGFDYSGSQYLAKPNWQTLYIYPADADYMPTSWTSIASIATASYAGGSTEVVWAKDWYIYTIAAGQEWTAKASAFIKKFFFNWSALNQIDSIWYAQSTVSGGYTGAPNNNASYWIHTDGNIYCAASARVGNSSFHGYAYIVYKLTPAADGNNIAWEELGGAAGGYIDTSFSSTDASYLWTWSNTTKQRYNLTGTWQGTGTTDNWTGMAKPCVEFDKTNLPWSIVWLNTWDSEDGIRIRSQYTQCASWTASRLGAIYVVPAVLTNKATAFHSFYYGQASECCFVAGSTAVQDGLIETNGANNIYWYWAVANTINDTNGIVDLEITDATIGSNRVKFKFTANSTVEKLIWFGITGGSYSTPTVNFETSEINLTL